MNCYCHDEYAKLGGKMNETTFDEFKVINWQKYISERKDVDPTDLVQVLNDLKKGVKDIKNYESVDKNKYCDVWISEKDKVEKANYLQSICIAILNIVIKTIYKQIAKLEKYDSIA